MPVLHGSLRSRPWCVSFPVFTSVLSRTTLPGLSPPPFCVAPLRDSFLIRFVFSPRRVRFRFPQLPPSLLSPSLRLVISTSVLLPSPRPQTIQLFPVHLSDPGSTSPTLRIRLLWPAGLPKRAHTTPPERQGQQGKRRQINLSLSITFTVEMLSLIHI